MKAILDMTIQVELEIPSEFHGSLDKLEESFINKVEDSFNQDPLTDCIVDTYCDIEFQ